MKKFTTLALTGAMVAAMSCTAFAGNINVDSADANLIKNDDGSAMYDVKAAGLTAADLNGATLTLSLTVDDSDGFGGGIMFNATTGGWMQDEDHFWGDADAEKALVAEGADGNYTVTFTIPDGTFDDADFAEEGYATIFIQQWWGFDVTLTGLALPTASEPVVDEEPTDDATETADVAPIAFLAAMVAVAGVAMVASKKRA